MSLSPMQEEFFRKFFARQREIGQKALDNVTLLAQTNIETILAAGLDSPNTIEKMENVIAKLKREKAKQAEETIQRNATIEALQKELDDLKPQE